MGKAGDFFKWYLHIDWKDITNWVAIILAVLLFWYGISNIISALS